MKTCAQCDTEMKKREDLSDKNEIYWQCPKCKSVTIEYPDAVYRAFKEDEVIA